MKFFFFQLLNLDQPVCIVDNPFFVTVTCVTFFVTSVSQQCVTLSQLYLMFLLTESQTKKYLMNKNIVLEYLNIKAFRRFEIFESSALHYFSTLYHFHITILSLIRIKIKWSGYLKLYFNNHYSELLKNEIDFDFYIKNRGRTAEFWMLARHQGHPMWGEIKKGTV